MAGQTFTKDDVVRRVLDGFQDRDAAKGIVEWIDSREKLIRKKDHDFATVIEIANQINAKSLDIEKIESYSMSLVMGQFGILRAFFMRQEDFSSPRIAVVGKSRNLPKVEFPIDSDLGRFLGERAGPVLLADEPETIQRYAEIASLAEVGIEVLLPLVRPGRGNHEDLKGCLCIGPKLGARPFEPEDLEFLKLLSNMVAISLHNAQLYHRSIIDGLTQVYTRGHFDIHLYQELKRAEKRREEEAGSSRRKAGKPSFVSLVLLDIDHFKRFNDSYGHLTGDRVLREAARLLEGSVRKVDVVARYGGEEFALILPETDKQDALILTERLRARLADHRVEDGEHRLQITASFGVSTFPVDAVSLRELVAQADRALYRAKEAGRNRVEGAPELPDAEGADGADGAKS